MESRREFIKKAGLLAGSLGVFSTLPKAIQAALLIDPAVGSTYLNAEHIVLLMQENRSFDHSFGTLRGVRGFNDPRAIRLPNKRPVWFQAMANGDTFSPFRLDIKKSNAAWTKDLPHSWENQIGAWNKGKFDNWLEAKRSGNKLYHDLPLTLGYYTREDIPFYYAFADAFTICDQHFCSSITGTTTNRHFFWTGTCVPHRGAKPLVRNSESYYNNMAKWKTFPERLEANHISWKVYQNELSLQSAVNGEDSSWLANFTDNNLEWFEQYQVRYKKSHIAFYKQRLAELPAEIASLELQLKDPKLQKEKTKLKQKQEQMLSFQKEVDRYSALQFEQLDDFTKNIHERAFQTNENDPYYHQTEEIEFEGQQLTVPKGDILHQFRSDARTGKLPAVSWLVAPQNFSDHPSAPMYGAWYVSEVLNILTENPELWKKTIFILNYDENDGYFDHIPPFVAPKPGDENTGKISADLDASTEYVTLEQELQAGFDANSATEGPVGLGYRVPLIIASPWTKGGWVNSDVCDITSTLQFMEHFFAKKFGKEIVEENISSWRRAVTSNLTSAFRTFEQKPADLPTFLDRNAQVAAINKAKDMPAPDGFKRWTAPEMDKHSHLYGTQAGAFQEPGIKPTNALAYELYVREQNLTTKHIELQFEAANKRFKADARAGVFQVYAYGYASDQANWSFAATAGNALTHRWQFVDFHNEAYELAIHGPNGFFQKYKGNPQDPKMLLNLTFNAEKAVVLLSFNNLSDQDMNIQVQNNYTPDKNKTLTIKKNSSARLEFQTVENHQWYDLKVAVTGFPSYERHFAGHLENGKNSMTDPLMGKRLA